MIIILSIFFILTGFLMRVSAISAEPVAKKGIALYHGPGGELAEDVAYALEKLSFSFKWVTHTNIQQGQLNDYYILIIPGGITIRLVQKLGELGLNHIREFVKKGECYLGICAGAYLASEKVEVSGRPEGLDLISVRMKRRSGIGSRKIILNSHPITKEISKTLTIHYQNGPDIIVEDNNVNVIATYENGAAAIVTSTYKKGKVILFSPHPEGSITQGYTPQMDTMTLLKNSIEYCLNDDMQMNNE